MVAGGWWRLSGNFFFVSGFPVNRRSGERWTCIEPTPAVEPVIDARKFRADVRCGDGCINSVWWRCASSQSVWLEAFAVVISEVVWCAPCEDKLGLVAICIFSIEEWPFESAKDMFGEDQAGIDDIEKMDELDRQPAQTALVSLRFDYTKRGSAPILVGSVDDVDSLFIFGKGFQG